jgi:8-oxo-dGTP diphosphatase
LEQIVVTAAFIRENGRILMAKRLPKGSEGGKWEFPGGKIEPGEDPRNCMLRELLEELGIHVEVGAVLEVISTVKEQRHIIIIYYECWIIGGELQTIECQDVRWLAPEEIDRLEKPESDTEFWYFWKDGRCFKRMK